MVDASKTSTPSIRLRRLGSGTLRADRDFVLYWMTAARRTRSNYALDRAIGLARELKRPLVVLEALRCDYPWASDRFHRFLLDGMRENAEAFSETGILYYPYVEPRVGRGRGLLRALAKKACVVVTDDSPTFFLPRMLAAAAEQVPVRLEAVDSNGLLPLAATDRVFLRAHDLRRFLQRELRPHLAQPPRRSPLARVRVRPMRKLPQEIERRWPRADRALLAAGPARLAELPIDHGVAPVDLEGGSRAGSQRLSRFLSDGLDRYPSERNQPDARATSGLSPHLHFGHVSPHQVLDALARKEGWTTESLGPVRNGARSGWWGMSEAAEGFLDELVTWRELGLNFAAKRSDSTHYSSLPSWARNTLELHESDKREHLYDLDALDRAETHDALWNAAQTELRESGRMHNYLRMLWGKNILAWSPGPRSALASMIELNNRYALDGRDPNSYSGIFWVLGRYDRAWGPERPVFGKVRFMTSANTRRKLRLSEYLQRWGRDSQERAPLFTP